VHKTLTLSVLLLGIASLFLERLSGSVAFFGAAANAADFLILGLSLLDLAMDLKSASYRFIYLRRNLFSIVFLALFTAFFSISKYLQFASGGDPIGGVAGLIVFRNAFILLKIFSRFRKLAEFLKSLVTKPAQTFVLSFLIAILAGALLLGMGPASVAGVTVSLSDALFTATSAVCVTGLSTVDVAATFSLWGKVVLLVLIQIGGLGIMILSFSTLFMFRRTISLENRLLASYLVNDDDLGTVGEQVARIAYSTFAIEAAGAIALFFAFPDPGRGLGERAFNALFHAVSAFCNAGFSLYGDSLESSGTAPALFVIASLIIVGGFSFSAIFDIADRLRAGIGGRSPGRKLRVNTVVVIRYSLGLIVAGTLTVYFFEHGNAMAGLPVGRQYLHAFFESVTLRTAGFNSISFDSLSRPAMLAMLGFMFVGGASGSTAGGIKVNTLAVMSAALRSYGRGGETPVIRGHRIDSSLVFRAFLIFVSGVAIVFCGVFALSLTESADFLDLLFETVSAFGTVGLSVGLTPSLSLPGKAIVMLLMFLGRVGPLTVAAAAVLAHRRGTAPGYPEADISVG